MIGISIKPTIGIGDALQFSSLPENYFRATGKRLIDVSKPWFFDWNPYVDRESKVTQVNELWNFSPTQYQWPRPRRGERPQLYLSNAEIWAARFDVPVTLNRPRLYRYEDVPFPERRDILLHIDGRSHGIMPDAVIDHVLKKYGPTGRLIQVGKCSGMGLGIPRINTETLWDLARAISEASMFIGMDSGPSWIAACYPDVVTKIVRSRPTLDVLKDWVPLDIGNIHAHWDDRCRQVHNLSEDDIGFTMSYRRL